jgi:hypothetical protein
MFTFTAPFLMPVQQFTNLEQAVLTFCLRRYQRCFYRWGHLLGWLSLPLLALDAVPALKSYRLWITGAGLFCIFLWYYFVLTRLVGKLAAYLEVGEIPITSDLPVVEGYRRLIPSRTTAIVFAAGLPVSVLILLSIDKGVIVSADLLVAAFKINGGLCLLTGFTAMVASYIAHFLKRRTLAIKLMGIGLNLSLWGFIVLAVLGAVPKAK